MDANLLSRLLRELIIDHDEVSLPGIGVFFMEQTPASVSEDGLTVYPPCRKLFFRTARDKNIDFLLFDLFIATSDKERKEAAAEFESFMADLRRDLDGKKPVVIPSFGKIRSTAEGNYYFVADRGMGDFVKDVALEPITVRPKSHSPATHVERPRNPDTVGGDTPQVVSGPDASVADLSPAGTDTKDSVAVQGQGTDKRTRMVILLVISAVCVIILVVLLSGYFGWLDSLIYSDEELRVIERASSGI